PAPADPPKNQPPFNSQIQMVPESAWATDEMPTLVKTSKATRATRNLDKNGPPQWDSFQPWAKPEKPRFLLSSRYALTMAMTATRILKAITAHSPAKRIW